MSNEEQEGKIKTVFRKFPNPGEGDRHHPEPTCEIRLELERTKCIDCAWIWPGTKCINVLGHSTRGTRTHVRDSIWLKVCPDCEEIQFNRALDQMRL